MIHNKIKKRNLISNAMKVLSCLLLLTSIASCLGEVKEKVKKAKEGISTTKGVIEKAQNVQEEVERLKEMTPLTNAELKEWLPKSLGNMKRTGFSVGKTGYVNVASITGDFKTEDKDKSFSVQIMDGAGPMGSVMASGMGLAGKLDIEEEDENKHMQPVTVDGVRAQQTYFKRQRRTSLQFVYGERFVVIISGTNMEPEETWKHIKALDLDGLKAITD